MSDNFTESWKLYEKGKDFFNKTSLVTNTLDAFRFYEGDHWRGLKSGGEQMPIVEVIKPIVDYRVAVVMQNDLQAIFTAQTMDEQRRQIDQNICDNMSQFWFRTWENLKMDKYCHQIARNAFIAGDWYTYFYFEPKKHIKNGVQSDGEIHMEMIPNSNIMLSDENEQELQKQRYILLIYRRDVEEIAEEAKKNGIEQDEIDKIQPDENKDVITGEKSEVGKKKCICIMKMWKEKGEVHITKATKTMEYLKDTNLHLTRYPVASFIPELKHGSARGISDVVKLIPNQVWINKLEAYRLISSKMCAFPKMAYTSNIINHEDLYMPGVAIEVQDTDTLKSATDSIGYINPAPMSQDAQIVFNEIMDKTKDAAGASDIATGRDTLDNAKALLATQQASQAPLRYQTEQFKAFAEDVTRIFYDFWCTYYTNGIHVVLIEETGQPYLFNLSNKELKEIDVDIRVDMSAKSPLDTLTEQQKVDNLLVNQLISFEEYAELTLVSEPLKPKLQKIVEKRAETQQMMAEQQATIEQQNMALDQASTDFLNLQENAKNATANAYRAGEINSAVQNAQQGV